MWLGDELGRWISNLFDIHRPNHRRWWRLGDEPSIFPTKFITGDKGGWWSLSLPWEPSLNTNHNFPTTIIEWNELDPGLRKAENLSVFKSDILKFIPPSPNCVYNCHNPNGLKFIRRLRLGLNHLRQQKFK